MIALTQEKREELASYARERIASHVIHGGCSDEEEIFKIALASLTLEAKQWVIHALGGDQFTTDGDYVANAEGMHGLRATPLFTVPPVPEIKLPDRELIPDWVLSNNDALDWYGSEIKRLNELGE